MLLDEYLTIFYHLTECTYIFLYNNYVTPFQYLVTCKKAGRGMHMLVPTSSIACKITQHIAVSALTLKKIYFINYSVMVTIKSSYFSYFKDKWIPTVSITNT